jgi:hypothetical protein
VAERYFDAGQASIGIISNKETVETLQDQAIEIINL